MQEKDEGPNFSFLRVMQWYKGKLIRKVNYRHFDVNLIKYDASRIASY